MKIILLTNDDGYESHGLLALVEALKPLGQVIVVAPSTEKSACGHSLTITKPLKLIKVSDDFFKLDDGTPSDCIYLALATLLKKNIKPDLIVSGINIGANLGEDITYSGTAGGAMEGTLHGIPSIAISQYYKNNRESLHDLNYELAKEVIYNLAKKILNSKFPLSKREFLNINIPPIEKKDFKGYKITICGKRFYKNDTFINKNPRGEDYHWIGVEHLAWEENIDTNSDIYAVDNGYVSITPIKLDMTSHEEIKNLKEWINE